MSYVIFLIPFLCFSVFPITIIICLTDKQKNTSQPMSSAPSDNHEKRHGDRRMRKKDGGPDRRSFGTGCKWLLSSTEEKVLQNLHDTMNREDYEYMSCKAEEKAVIDRLRKLRKEKEGDVPYSGATGPVPRAKKHHHPLLNYLNNNPLIAELFLEVGLITLPKCDTCKEVMPKENMTFGRDLNWPAFQCRRTAQCKKAKSKKQTKFPSPLEGIGGANDHTKMTMTQVLLMAWGAWGEVGNEPLQLLAKATAKTLGTWKNDVMSSATLLSEALQDSTKLGGKGGVVEIDEFSIGMTI